MARAPSNPQRNIECQGVAGVQELQESKGRLQVRPMVLHSEGFSEFISFKSMTQSQALPFCNF
jgi:hypothetical protein